MPPSRYQAWLETLPEFDPTQEGFFLYAKPINGMPNVVLRCTPGTEVIYEVRSVATSGYWYVDPVTGTMRRSTNVVLNMTEVLQNLGLQSWTPGQWNATTMRTYQIIMAWQPPG